MFWVKKILSMLLMPIPFILLLLVSCLFLFKHRFFTKVLLAFTICLTVFLSSNLGMRILVAPLESQYAMNTHVIEGECIVLVLGSDHELVSSRHWVQRLSSTALMRLSEGIHQLSYGDNCTLVTSGWSGTDSGDKNQSHAYVAAQAAQALGVDKSKIVMLSEARDTIEEAEAMAEIFGRKPFRLVTSATHMPRAMEIFMHQGLSPQAAPADFIGREDVWWRLSAENIHKCRRAIHEYLGMAWLRLKAQLSL